MMLNDPRGQRENLRAAMDLKEDAVKGVAEADRELKELKSGRLDRMIDDASRELKRAGFNIDAGMMKQVATKAITELQLLNQSRP